MSHVGYVATAWGLTLGAGAVYAIHLVRRGRSLASRVAPERRRWMTTRTVSDHVDGASS